MKKQTAPAVSVMMALLLSACANWQSGPPAPAALPASAPAAPARPVPPPASLIGVGPETVRAALGNPAFKRAETGSEIWQYGAGRCRLFVYFYYADGATAADDPMSTHIDARQATGGAADVDACLSEIVQAQSAPGP